MYSWKVTRENELTSYGGLEFRLNYNLNRERAKDVGPQGSV